MEAARVSVSGEDALATAARQAITAQDDLVLSAGPADARLAVGCAGITGAVDVDGETHVLPARAPAPCALERLARELPGARRASATVLAPAGEAGARHGPVDALRVGAPLSCRTPGPAGLDVELQTIVTPHTLCWLLVVAIELDHDVQVPEAAERMRDASRVVLAPAALDIGDTAALADLMRDHPRGASHFFEVVVFEGSLRAGPGVLRLVLAVDAGLPAAETVDELRLRLTEPGDRGRAQRRTDAALGVLHDLSFPQVVAR